MNKTLLKKIVILVMAALVLLLVVCCIIIPRFHKKISSAGAVPYPVNLGSACERVLCVDDNVQALLWRLRVIEEAKEELIFATYSFQEDESGTDIMAALLHAAERGVKVRIVVDGVTAFLDLRKSECFQALSTAPNVEVRVYNPVSLLKPWGFNYRMHDKYLIADDTVYILGGRNTKNLSLGDYQERKDIDRDMVVYSGQPDGQNSLAQVREYFERIWALSGTKKFPTSGGKQEKAVARLHAHYESLRKHYPDAFQQIDWYAHTIPTRGIRLLTNPIEPKNKAPELWHGLIQLMNEGKQSIVQTPYLICDGQMYEDLTALWRDGKKVEIILNSVESGANIFGCTDYLNEKQDVLGTGAHIYEYVGARSCHTKTVLIDHDISVVGSFNFDMRSVYLDTEMMLVLDCPELNRQLRSAAQKQMNESRQYLPDGTVSHGPDYEPRKLGLGKYILYGLLRAVILPIRHLL